MEKRIISILLCFSIIASMFVRLTPVESAEAMDGQEQQSETQSEAVLTKGGKAVFNKDTVTLYLNYEDSTESQVVNLTDRGVLTLSEAGPITAKWGETIYLLDWYEGTDEVAKDLINRTQHAYPFVKAEDLAPYVENVPGDEPGTTTPDDGEEPGTTTPDDGEGTVPDDGTGTTPDDETETTPGEDVGTTPGEGEGTNPDEGDTSIENDPNMPELEERYQFTAIHKKAVFKGDTVYLLKDPLGTSSLVVANTEDLPVVFHIHYMVTDTSLDNYNTWYVISMDADWEIGKDWNFCYVSVDALEFLSTEMGELLYALFSAKTVDAIEDVAANADGALLQEIPEVYVNKLEAYYNKLVVAETCTFSNNEAEINGVKIPVSVTGVIPTDKGLTLSVTPVSDADVMNGGFNLESVDDIIAALDIKLIDANGDEWQPREGRYITVDIGIGALGYEDGRIFKLQHKHGESVTTFDVFIVMDGKLTLKTNGFSVYLVSAAKVTPENNASAIATTGSNKLTLEVGDEVYYYVDINALSGAGSGNPSIGTWQINDPTGAIYWEVYTNTAAGNVGVYAPWIKVVALKEVSNLEMYFAYRNNNSNGSEKYSLTIQKPKPTSQDADGYRLYIQDDVNDTGSIVAMLVDASGNEVKDSYGNNMLANSATKFSWERNDKAIIMPWAYDKDDNNRSINIAKDHSGLLQRRVIDGVPQYVTYTLTVTLPNGRKKTAEYTVYYCSEIINMGFESPAAVSGTYTFFANGQAGLYWKTTSPGWEAANPVDEDEGNLTKDIEYARYNADGENNITGNGVSFFPSTTCDANSTVKGIQFAELNAENYGALYQDIITTPHESVDWEFYHAARNTNGQSTSARNYEAMFLIMGPTESAQAIVTEKDIEDLIKAIRAVDGNDSDLKAGKKIDFTYTDGATYTVWYHDADRDTAHQSADKAWAYFSGSYTPGDNQYRTRLFFVSDPASTETKNYGNLIDSAKSGQYRDYLIEYYEETYDNATNTMSYVYLGTKRLDGGTHKQGEALDQEGTEILYSSVELKDFDYFEVVEQDLLSTVLINGENSPYSLRYAGEPKLFIEKYPNNTSNVKNFDTTNNKKTTADYQKKDIVMQVFFRDTVIAVQKKVEFPTITVGEEKKEALTISEKQDLVDDLIAENGRGYESHFHLTCLTPDPDLHKDKDWGEGGHLVKESIYIKKNDPSGWYTGYVPFGDNPAFGHQFSLTETKISKMPGLELDKVTFTYYQFENGQKKQLTPLVYGGGTVANSKYPEVKIGADGKVVAYDQENNTWIDVSYKGIEINKIHRLAEIEVVNSYREKEVTINYVAVGLGNIDVQNNGVEFTKSGSETILYYSGNPVGAVAQPDEDCTFAGWYLDPECTNPVTEYHGYLDDNTFIPNKARTVSDTTLEVTYYAKFSSGTGSIQIVKENALPGQSFVYEVKKKDSSDVMYVTLVAGSNGRGTVEIINAEKDKEYTITQIVDWSWGYEEDAPITKKHSGTSGINGTTTIFTFSGSPSNEFYSALSNTGEVKKNIYGSGG